MGNGLFTEIQDPVARRIKLTDSAAIEGARLKKDISDMGEAGLPLNNSVNYINAAVKAIAEINHELKTS